MENLNGSSSYASSSYVSERRKEWEERRRQMKELNVEKVFIDKISGKNTERPQLKEMMSFVRTGDTVVVESISRFARNTKDLLDLVEQLAKKQVEFVSKKESIEDVAAVDVTVKLEGQTKNFIFYCVLMEKDWFVITFR